MSHCLGRYVQMIDMLHIVIQVFVTLSYLRCCTFKTFLLMSMYIFMTLSNNLSGACLTKFALCFCMLYFCCSLCSTCLFYLLLFGILFLSIISWLLLKRYMSLLTINTNSASVDGGIKLLEFNRQVPRSFSKNRLNQNLRQSRRHLWFDRSSDSIGKKLFKRAPLLNQSCFCLSILLFISLCNS